MSGSLRSTWQYLYSELWEPLADYSTAEDSAPSDLFSDLYEAADDFLSPRPSAADMAIARNDVEIARARFFVLKGTDFRSESACVQFLEEAHKVIVDYEGAGLVDLYVRLVRDAVRKFNLRYRLDEPFILRFLLPGSFSNLYGELQRLNRGNAYLADLLTDFEKTFDRYVRTQDSTDLRVCISRASNYAEGLASVTRGTPGTLGALCNQLTDWPHDKVKEALQSLYKFCSDYPGTRHGGDPEGVRRALAPRDATLASLLIVSFCGYLSPTVDEQVMLGG
jgi:hypothetical protein